MVTGKARRSQACSAPGQKNQLCVCVCVCWLFARLFAPRFSVSLWPFIHSLPHFSHPFGFRVVGGFGRSYTLHLSALCCCVLLLPLGAVTPQIRSTVLGLTLAPLREREGGGGIYRSETGGLAKAQGGCKRFMLPAGWCLDHDFLKSLRHECLGSGRESRRSVCELDEQPRTQSSAFVEKKNVKIAQHASPCQSYVCPVAPAFNGASFLLS